MAEVTLLLDQFSYNRSANVKVKKYSKSFTLIDVILARKLFTVLHNDEVLSTYYKEFT